jgi:hypothetical protein
VISIAHARITVLISIDTKMQLHMLLRATAQLQRSIWKTRKINGLFMLLMFSPHIGYTNLGEKKISRYKEDGKELVLLCDPSTVIQKVCHEMK